MTGPTIDCACTLVGGIIGSLVGHRLSPGLRTNLPLTFGVASMGMGAAMIVRMHSLPPVVIALILGAIIGEVLRLEARINQAASATRHFIDRLFPAGSRTGISHDEFLVQFVAVLVLFCASGTGIFGSMNEGITGDSSLLLAKAVLDLFTAAIFATSLGISIAAIAIPQFAVQAALYLLGRSILPLTTPAMIADFSSTGGMIMLATGFRIAGIKAFPIANMLPALLLAMPVSQAWARWVG